MLTIYAAIKDISISEAENKFQDEKDYGKFKNEVAYVVWQELDTLQYNINQILDKQVFLSLDDGQKRAARIASETLYKVYKKVGLK